MPGPLTSKDVKLARRIGEELLAGVGEAKCTRIDLTSSRVVHVRRPLLPSEEPLLPAGWLDSPAIDLAGGTGPGFFGD